MINFFRNLLGFQHKITGMGGEALVPEPEKEARGTIDKLLAQAGWLVCDANQSNIHATCGVAIREFPLKSGHGAADYLLYVDGKAAGLTTTRMVRVEQQDRDMSILANSENWRTMGQYCIDQRVSVPDNRFTPSECEGVQCQKLQLNN